MPFLTGVPDFSVYARSWWRHRCAYERAACPRPGDHSCCAARGARSGLPGKLLREAPPCTCSIPADSMCWLLMRCTGFSCTSRPSLQSITTLPCRSRAAKCQRCAALHELPAQGRAQGGAASRGCGPSQVDRRGSCQEGEHRRRRRRLHLNRHHSISLNISPAIMSSGAWRGVTTHDVMFRPARRAVCSHKLCSRSSVLHLGPCRCPCPGWPRSTGPSCPPPSSAWLAPRRWA